MAGLFTPDHLGDAVRYLRQALADQQPVTVIAGGTDLYPAHVGRPLPGAIMNIARIDGLRDIRPVAVDGGAHLELGAAVTWSDLVRRRHAQLQIPRLDALVMAAAEVGGVQIQNRGTIAGNLCNASPAADSVPALQALDARVVLVSADGERRMPLTDFISGPRQTRLAPGELVRAIQLPLPGNAASHSIFLKLGARRYLVISAAMAALRLDWQDNRVSQAAVSIGSCGPVACRLVDLENQLVGKDAAQVKQFAGQTLADSSASSLFRPLSPIDDMRGSAAYRLDAANHLIRRGLLRLAESPGQSVGPVRSEAVI